MPAFTLGYSQIEEQIRVIRRRRNGFILQHAVYLCGGMVVFAIALLVFLAGRAERLAFTFAFWAALGAIMLSLAAAVQIVWRRWITAAGTPRWIDRVAQLDDRLSTLLAHRRDFSASSHSPPLSGGEVKRGNRLLPALISQLFALRYRWEPATLVPRRVPRSLYFFVAATVALIATSFVARPPAPPQRFSQNKIIPIQGNRPDGGTGLRMTQTEGNGAASGSEHPMNGSVDDAETRGMKRGPDGHGNQGRGARNGSSDGMRSAKGATGRLAPGDDANAEDAERGAAQALPDRVQEMIRHALHQPPMDDAQRRRDGGDSTQQQAKHETKHDGESKQRSQDEHAPQMAQSGRDAEQRSRAAMSPPDQPDNPAAGRGSNGVGGGAQGTSGVYGKGAPAAALDPGASKTFQLKLVLQGQSPGTKMEPQKPGHGDVGGLGFPAERETSNLPLNPHQRADEPLVRSEIPAEHESMIKRIFSRGE